MINLTEVSLFSYPKSAFLETIGSILPLSRFQSICRQMYEPLPEFLCENLSYARILIKSITIARSFPRKIYSKVCTVSFERPEVSPLNVYSPSAIIGLSLLNSILMARFLKQSFAQTCLKETTMVNCSNLFIPDH